MDVFLLRACTTGIDCDRPCSLQLLNLNLSVKDPTEGHHAGLLLRPFLSSLFHLAKPARQTADVVLSPSPLPRQPRHFPNLPPPDEELHHVPVVLAGIHPEPLRDGGVVAEDVPFLPIEHEPSRHFDPLPHHVRQRQHGRLRIDLEQLLHDLRVRHLVALLVRGDQPTDLRQQHVAVLLGFPCCVSVGDEGCPLLEGRVHEAMIRIVVCLYRLSKTQSN